MNACVGRAYLHDDESIRSFWEVSWKVHKKTTSIKENGDLFETKMCDFLREYVSLE